MPVPWLQIVQLVPSILDVSRELMKRTKQARRRTSCRYRSPRRAPGPRGQLEENERRQAELVANG